MIVIKKVLSLDKSEVMAFEIVIESAEDHTFFIASDQSTYPGLRKGPYPHSYENEELRIFPRESALRLKEILYKEAK